MSLPPRSRQPRRVDDKDNDYRRLPPADHRSGYDGFHPGYTPTYYPGDAVRSLYAPSYHRGLPPTGHRHRYDDRRQRSPRSSFLDPVPLGTSNTNDGQREINVDDNVRRYAAWSDAVNEARGVQILNAGAAAKAELQNSNKRPASSSDLITEHENSPKRQRQHPRDASSLLKENQRPTTSSMGHTFVETKGGQAPGQADRKQQLATDTRSAYVDASTQTTSIHIPSSRLAQFQEEEAVARAKHEAEMARRKQALELELDHERKVLELRRRFEAPVTKREPSLAAAKISYSPAQQDVFDAHTYPSEETVRPKDTSVAKESDPQKGALNSVQELKIIGDSQKSPNAPQEPVQRNDAGQKSPTKSEPSDILNRLLGSPPDPSTQNRPRRNLEQNKRPEHPMSETKNRPVSERSSLVHIKTSVSPISATAREPVAPITAKDRQEDKGHRRRPTVKHLTCYFWKNGNCTKRADECSYAHHDTGYTAMAPESLKRMRNDGSYYRRGAWKR